MIMIGMILGITVGIVCHSLFDPAQAGDLIIVQIFKIGGNLFLNMFRMIVVPVVLVSMILGASTMYNPSLLCRVGSKTIGLFALTTVLASALGIGISLLVNVGKGVTITFPENDTVKISGTMQSLTETLSNIIPGNIFQAFSGSNMLQIIVIAIISGIVLARIREKVPLLLSLLEELNQFNMVLIDMVLHIAPVGVFFLLAHTFSLFGFAVLLPLGKYFLCFLAVCSIILLVVHPLLLRLAAGVSPLQFWRKMTPVMLLAFSTSSSNAALPSNIETATKKLGIPRNLATFILSLGATINMDGTAIMQSCATILIAQLYGIDLSCVQIIEIISMCLLASIGSAGIPNSGVLMLALVLQTIGLPLDGIALILSVDYIADMFSTLVNITGDAVSAVIVSASEKSLDREVFNRMNNEIEPLKP